MPVFALADIICCISYILKIKTEKYTFKNETVYLFRKFEENPPIFTKLSWRSYLFFSLCFIL